MVNDWITIRFGREQDYFSLWRSDVVSGFHGAAVPRMLRTQGVCARVCVFTQQNRAERYTILLALPRLKPKFSLLSGWIFPTDLSVFPRVSFSHTHCFSLTPPTTLSLSRRIYILWDQPWLGRLEWTAVQSTRSLPLCLIPDLKTARETGNTFKMHFCYFLYYEKLLYACVLAGYWLCCVGLRV